MITSPQCRDSASGVVTDENFGRFLDALHREVAALPQTAVHLVGALVVIQENLPPWLKNSLMYLLSLREDFSEVTPAAEAMMKLGVYAPHLHETYAKTEILQQVALLKAVALDDKVFVAAAFLAQVANHMRAFIVEPALAARSQPDVSRGGLHH